MIPGPNPIVSVAECCLATQQEVERALNTCTQRLGNMLGPGFSIASTTATLVREPSLDSAGMMMVTVTGVAG